MIITKTEVQGIVSEMINRSAIAERCGYVRTTDFFKDPDKYDRKDYVEVWPFSGFWKLKPRIVKTGP